MYPKFFFILRWEFFPQCVTRIPSTFSFVQVILFRVRDRGRTLNLLETKLWMSDTELRMLSLRLVGFITVIIHGSVEEQWIFWRHTRSACVTSCWKNVNAHTNFISTPTVLFLGIQNCCRCTAVGLWYGNWPFLPFLCFSLFSIFCFYFLCLFIVSLLYFISVSLYVFIFNFHIFRSLPLSFISSIFPSFF